MPRTFRVDASGTSFRTGAVVRLMLVAAMLLAACTTGPPRAITVRVAEPSWTRQSAPTMTYDQMPHVLGVAGWNGGFVVAGNHYWQTAPEVGESATVLYVSEDGETWREVPAPDSLWFSGKTVAGYGDHVYVLGSDRSSPRSIGMAPVLLTFENDAWTQLSLPGATAEDRAMSVVAGPRGVMVIALTGSQTSRTSLEAKIWYSADGVTFDAPTSLDALIDVDDANALVATDRGFLMPVSVRHSGQEPISRSSRLYESVDGREWTATSEFPPLPSDVFLAKMQAVQHHNGVTVAFGVTQTRAGVATQTAWYRRDEEKTWTPLDLGRAAPPEAGVVSVKLREVYEVFPWRTGFIAVGSTLRLGVRAAAVWTSPDGVNWRQTPPANGFESPPVSSPQLRFATDGKTSLLLWGMAVNQFHGPIQIWRAES